MNGLGARREAVRRAELRLVRQRARAHYHRATLAAQMRRWLRLGPLLLGGLLAGGWLGWRSREPTGSDAQTEADANPPRQTNESAFAHWARELDGLLHLIGSGLQLYQQVEHWRQQAASAPSNDAELDPQHSDHEDGPSSVAESRQ